MTLKDELGAVPRTLYFLFGVLLAAATISTAYHDWPLIQSGKSAPVGFALETLIALPLALLIMVWACIGRHREWRIADNQIRVRNLSLTSWQTVRHIHAEDIASFSLESYAHDDAKKRMAYTLRLLLKDGRRLESPRTFDEVEAAKARLQIESMGRMG